MNVTTRLMSLVLAAAIFAPVAFATISQAAGIVA